MESVEKAANDIWQAARLMAMPSTNGNCMRTKDNADTIATCITGCAQHYAGTLFKEMCKREAIDLTKSNRELRASLKETKEALAAAETKVNRSAKIIEKLRKKNKVTSGKAGTLTKRIGILEAKLREDRSGKETVEAVDTTTDAS